MILREFIDLYIIEHLSTLIQKECILDGLFKLPSRIQLEQRMIKFARMSMIGPGIQSFANGTIKQLKLDIYDSIGLHR